MSAMARVCAILAAFGALNWVALWFLDDDLVTVVFGVQHALVPNLVMIVVGLASLYALVAALGIVGIGAKNK